MSKSKLFLELAILLLAMVAFSEGLGAQTKPEAPQPAQGAAPPNPPAQATDNDADHPKLRQRNPRYRVQADDILELSFRYTPEFDQEVTVQPDGYVQLKGAYANILHDPVISVVLRDFEKPYFVAGGQVGKPGKYDLRGETSASQAIAIAGGFVDFAKNKQVLLFRRYTDDTVEVKVLNLKRVFNNKDPREDVTLQPGDMLYVPKTFMATIDRFLPRTSLGTYFSPALL